MAGVVEATFAAALGRDLAAIHGRSAGDPDLARRFDNDGTFESIRMTPYLRATARAHPGLADRLNGLADRTLATRLALVHGDVSPKNILHGPEHPVFLDAECACWGDPAFDLAFCLNHLLLKGAWRRDLRDRYLGAVAALAHAYLAGVIWEDPVELERRASAMLRALFLGRVDGTSPSNISTKRDVTRSAPPRSNFSAPSPLALPRSPIIGAARVAEPEIAAVRARRIWDSRGRPTVEAEVELADGTLGRGVAPAGASRGSREAVDRRDGGARLGGLNVAGAIAAVRDEIAPALRGMDPADQAGVDARLIALDGTPTKARLGGNAIVAASMAVLHAAAAHARHRCGRIWREAGRSRFPCPKSRSSAAARTPGVASTSRI